MTATYVILCGKRNRYIRSWHSSLFFFFWGLESGTISAFIHCLIEDCFFLPWAPVLQLVQTELAHSTILTKNNCGNIFSWSLTLCPQNSKMCTVIKSLRVYKHLAWCCWQCFAQSFDWSSPIVLWSLLLTSIRRLWCSSVPLYVSEMNDLSSFPVPFVVECHFCCRMKDIVSNNYNTTAMQSFSL